MFEWSLQVEVSGPAVVDRILGMDDDEDWEERLWSGDTDDEEDADWADDDWDEDLDNDDEVEEDDEDEDWEDWDEG